MKICRVTVTIRQPKGDDVGQVAEGRFLFEDGVVTLVNHVGTPVRDHDGKTYTQKLEPNEDAYTIAGRLTKAFRRARLGDKHKDSNFSAPINYPKTGWM